MEITMGMIVAAVSALGFFVCLIGLIATIPMFKKRRKKLLEKIEAE